LEGPKGIIGAKQGEGINEPFSNQQQSIFPATTRKYKPLRWTTTI